MYRSKRVRSYKPTGGATGYRAARRQAYRNKPRYSPYKRAASRPSVEVKFLDNTDVNTSPIATTGSILNSGSLNLIAQGTDENERIGRKCTLKSIHLRGNFFLPADTDLDNSDYARLILYWDRQANGAAATAANIMERTDINSFRNLSNTGRFVILADITEELNIQAASGDGGANNDTGRVEKCFTINKKVNIPLEFDSTAGAITELRSNNVGVLCFSNHAEAGVIFDARVRFTDM